MDDGVGFVFYICHIKEYLKSLNLADARIKFGIQEKITRIYAEQMQVWWLFTTQYTRKHCTNT